MMLTLDIVCLFLCTCLLLCMIVLFCCLVRVLRLKRLEDDLSEKMRKIPLSMRSSADGLGSANKSMLFTNYVLSKLDGPPLTALQVDNLTEEELAVILKQRRHPTIEDFEEKYGKKVLTEEAELSPIERAIRSGEEAVERKNNITEEELFWELKKLRHFSDEAAKPVFCVMSEIDKDGRKCEGATFAPRYDLDEAENLFDVDYTPVCPRGYDDCIWDPARIKHNNPDWYKRLYGDLTPEEAIHVPNGCFERYQRDPNMEYYCWDDEEK